MHVNGTRHSRPSGVDSLDTTGRYLRLDTITNRYLRLDGPTCEHTEEDWPGQHRSYSIDGYWLGDCSAGERLHRFLLGSADVLTIWLALMAQHRRTEFLVTGQREWLEMLWDLARASVTLAEPS
jgi:hypothetical protein